MLCRMSIVFNIIVETIVSSKIIMIYKQYFLSVGFMPSAWYDAKLILKVIKGYLHTNPNFFFFSFDTK